MNVSVLSVVWTLLTGCAAVAFGFSSASAVLVAFGMVGFLDALGSAALAYHFRHALKHEAASEDLERLAHRIVILGLLIVGVGAVVGGVARLWSGGVAKSSVPGTVVAAVSLGVLIVLSRRKAVLARRVSSAALRSDGHLSAVGAAQAAVTLTGTVTVLLGWGWVDPASATVIGAVAIVVGARARTERGGEQMSTGG